MVAARLSAFEAAVDIVGDPAAIETAADGSHATAGVRFGGRPAWADDVPAQGRLADLAGFGDAPIRARLAGKGPGGALRAGASRERAGMGPGPFWGLGEAWTRPGRWLARPAWAAGSRSLPTSA